jgi:hypothetical protein
MLRTIINFKTTKKKRVIPTPSEDDMIGFWTNFDDILLKRIREVRALNKLLSNR